MATHFDKSHYTAIQRTKLSAPARYLLEHDLLKGRILDYGCGRGDLVSFAYREGMRQYDPYWFNEPLKKADFDTVYCGYVLNVLPKEKRLEVLVNIIVFLKEGGKGYVAVRRDVKKEGRRKCGTEQYNVVLPGHEVLVENRSFAIYVLTKKEEKWLESIR